MTFMKKKCLRLVIADNESIIRLDLREMLEDAGHEVVGEAMENPTKVLRGSVENKNVQCVVKAVQLPDDAGKNRIVLVLEPEK